jgi:hypothetical protein
MTNDAAESAITTPAYSTRPVRSTLVAGDALAAGFQFLPDRVTQSQRVPDVRPRLGRSR